MAHWLNGQFFPPVYDPILREHIKSIAESQSSGHRLSAHYLSSDSQNEFISACAQLVRTNVMKEQQLAKYYSIIVDATHDSSHVEHIVRYVSFHDTCSIQECFVGLQQKDRS